MRQYVNRHTGRRIYDGRVASERRDAARSGERKPSESWAVPAGSPCQVRRVGEKEWREHVTKEDAQYESFRWRNELFYGFSKADWEMKVSIRYVYAQTGK